MKYKIGISFLFLSLLFGTPIEASSKSEGFCGRYLLLLAKHYVQQVPGGWLNPTEIPKSEWVVSETDGLVQVESFESMTGRIQFLMPGKTNPVLRKAYPTTTVETRGRFARLGTEAARQLIETRTSALFTHPENFEYFYALKGIGHLGGNLQFEAPAVILLKKIWDEIKHRHPDLGDFIQALALWREGYSFKRKGTPNTNLSAEKRIQALKDFAEEYYRQTGLNLVQGGILSYEPNINQFGTVHLAGRASASATNADIPMIAVRNLVLGGDGSNIPLDVYQHLLVENWKVSGRNMDLIGQSNLWVASLEKGSELEGKIDSLKNSSDLTELEPLLNEISQRDAFQAFQANIPKDTLIVPMPSTSEQNGASRAIANWLAQKLGTSQADVNTIQKMTSGTPQHLLPTLYHRIINLRERQYKISPNVADKEIVLVDDNITTGASIVFIKQLLMKAGAKAVHVFSLTKTGSEPLLDFPQLLVPVAERNRKSESLSRLASAAGPAQVEETLAQKIENWTAQGSAPWDGVAAKEVTKDTAKMRMKFREGLVKPDIQIVALLTEATLSRLTGEGKIVPSQKRGNLWKEIETDSAMQARVIKQLYDIRDEEVYVNFINTPFIQKTIDMVQKQPAVNPLSNHLDADVLAWVRTLPMVSAETKDKTE